MGRKLPDNYHDFDAERAVVRHACYSLDKIIKAMEPEAWVGSPVIPDGTIIVGCSDDVAMSLPDIWENHIVLIHGYQMRLPSQTKLHQIRRRLTSSVYYLTKAQSPPPQNATGRPRNLDIERRVLSMLADGVPVGKIAKEVGVHRNTVWNIKSRTISRTKLQEKSS